MKHRVIGFLSCLSCSGTLSAQEPVDSIRLLAPFQSSPAIELRAVGDAESDGDQDVLFLGLDRIQTWLNDGGGGFSPGPETSLPFPNNHFRDSVQFGDVTADGLADVVVIDLGLPLGLLVYPGLPGGTFGPFEHIPTNTASLGFDLGDADGDGDLDIVELHGEAGGEYVTWWSWNGAGFSANAPLIETDAGTLLRALEAVDLDLDGDHDVVVVDALGPNLITLPTVAGSPTLGVSVPLGIPASTSYSVVGGDLDGDLDGDVVVARLFSSRLDIQPILSAGTGAVTAAPAQILEEYDVNSYAVPFHLGDWDGDGDAELLSEARVTEGGVSRPGFYVHENDGAHAFTRRSHIISDTQIGGAGPADFNGDGVLDFASAAGIKFGDGTFHDTLVRIDPVEHRARDWDDDGDLDLYGAGTLGAISANDGTGAFTEVPDLIPPLPLTDPQEFYASPILLGDFNGDGRLDFIAELRLFVSLFQTEFVAMHLLLDDGLGAFVDVGNAAPAGVQIPGNGHPESQLFAFGTHDLDGNGSQDIVTDGGYWANDGSGFFAAFTPLFGGRPVAAFDIEGDGDLDLVTYTGPAGFGTPAQMNLQRHDGSLGFTSEPVLSAPFLHFRAEAEDLDEDGDLDLTIGTEFQRNELYVFENLNGSLVPGPVLTVDFSEGNAVFVEDFNGDGLGDLATGASEYDTNESDEAFFVFPRLGPGVAYGAPSAYIGRSLQGGADVDADGDLDGLGEAVVRNWELNGPGAGVIRQYGTGDAGAGGAIPVLGASGPLQPGSTSASIRIRRGLGGAPAILAFGSGEAALIDLPLPGMTTWIDPITFGIPVVLGGTPGAPGAGVFDLALDGVLVSGAGLTFYAQAVLLDAAGDSGFSSTNGLELLFGL
ncbi:MAG: VCBS repeat-containing protein [Planctomycetota bacterium]